MKRQAVFVPGRPRPNRPYSPGIRLGNLLFTAGAVGSGQDGRVPPDIQEQTRNTIESLRAILEAAGSSLDHALKVTIYVTDMNEYAAVNDVYRTFFTGDLPARSTVGVATLATEGARIEIDMIAQVPS